DSHRGRWRAAASWTNVRCRPAPGTAPELGSLPSGASHPARRGPSAPPAGHRPMDVDGLPLERASFRPGPVEAGPSRPVCAGLQDDPVLGGDGLLEVVPDRRWSGTNPRIWA